MIFEVGDYLHSGERRLRGRRRIFMNGWLLFPECVCPLSLSFLKQNHLMHILYCKGACSWMIFCMVFAILYTILWKSNEHSFNQFSLQQPIKKKNAISIPDHLCCGNSPPLQHISSRFLLNCSQAPGSVQSLWGTCCFFLHIVLCWTIVRSWSDAMENWTK